MISYYRIYYDQRITNLFNSVDYIYIHKPLPTYEIDQRGLADFINSNKDNVSFKLKLNEPIYAIVRYFVVRSEMKIPLEKECIFDLFIFPTPIKNKRPSYVTTQSIKGAPLQIIKKKTNEMNLVTFNNFEDIVGVNSYKYAGFNSFYKRAKSYYIVNKQQSYGNELYNTYADFSNYDSVYSGKIKSLPIRCINVKSIEMKNAIKMDATPTITHSFIPYMRVVNKTDWDSHDEN